LKARRIVGGSRDTVVSFTSRSPNAQNPAVARRVLLDRPEVD
jgi:hypothetical protein